MTSVLEEFLTPYEPELNPEEILTNTVDRYDNAQDYADAVKGYVTDAINTLVANGTDTLYEEGLFDPITEGLFNIDDGGISGINPNEPSVPDVATVTVGEPTAVVGTAPSIEDLNLEEIDYNIPLMDLTSPEAEFNYTEETYSSDIADRLEVNILDSLINGGTGLNADIEQAIWDRATGRQILENEKTYDEALNFWSSRGFSMPPGMLNGTLIEARERIAQKNTDLNNDILVQSSNLAQVNTQFTITSAIQIEKNLMDNFNQHRSRALEAAKIAVEVLVDIYQIKLEEYKTKLTGEQISAQIYEARIRAAVAKLEIKLGVHQADIEAYKAAIQHYDSQVKKLVAQAEARVSAEGLKVETFKAQSGHYTAEIDAVIKAFLGKIEQAKAHGDVLIKEREVALQKLLGEASLTSEQVTALSRIAGQLAAASLTSVSASTNIGVSHSQSDSKTYANNHYGSRSLGVSHSVNYQGEGSPPTMTGL